MPSGLKKIHTQTFTDGINTVTAPEYMKPSEARYMLNCYTLSTGVGNVGVVTNIKGNTLVSDTMPVGDNKCIGVVSNEENSRFFYFVWNSEGYHSIRMYDEISNSIIKIVESITDTGGLDVLKFSKDYLILMGDVVRDELLYWVDGLNDARKININKALDPTISGYAGVIEEQFINAYKLAPAFAPTLQYFSDTSKSFNYLYGKLRKFAYRFVYDDGEKSTFSAFSSPSIPPYENFNGVNSIPTDNNGIQLTVDTGSIIVKQVEIVMWSPTETVPSPNWVSIAVIDKQDKGIGSDTQFIYNFYNDGSYPAISDSEISPSYSYLPKAPKCQAVAGGSMIYSNFKEGFENVNIDVEAVLSYEELFIEDSQENILNDADITIQPIAGQADYIRTTVFQEEKWTNLDGSLGFKRGITRAQAYEVRIGNDVKKGNNFKVSLVSGDQIVIVSYEATLSDDATTVAFQLKQQMIGHGVIILRPADGSLNTYNINDNTYDGLGNLTFRFWGLVKTDTGGYYNATASVNDVYYNSLKDTGQSVPNMKLGAGTKYGIVYYDLQGRHSLVYTDDVLNTTTATENSLGGIKSPVVTLSVKHLPPIWAKYWEVVRTRDLTFASFIDMLIQKVIDVPATNENGEYLDLVVGSLYTYQRIHPNTTLKYEFKKGDRIRLKKKIDGTYYPDFETEILSYKELTNEAIESNVIINGTTTITVATASASNIGRYVVIDGYERQIMSAPTTTTYILNAAIGNNSSPTTILGYNLVDRRGLMRIRKPNVSSGISVSDNSVVEIFTPSVSGDDFGSRQFYHFNKKFDVINYGLPNRYHSGNVQNQSGSQDAIVRVNDGTVYVRNRELPLTNNIPNAQVYVTTIEDPAYSDFYYSTLNANGRPNIEDNNLGVVHFGDRMRFSATQIEDTRILGFSWFENLNRKDYNDKYGDIMLTISTENQILVFKMFKDCIVPVFQTVIQDASGQEVLGVSRTLLNDIRYYSHDGGIGDNPESYCRNENNHYHVSPNSGCWVRLGGDGATPISEIYLFDNEARRIINEASKNGTYIFGGFDPLLTQAIWSIEGYVTKTLSTGFDTGYFETLSPVIPSSSPQSITVMPINGTLSVLTDGKVTYTPNEGYVGSDGFQYQTVVDGETITRKVCLNVQPIPVVQPAWRAKVSSGSCVLVDGATTGFLAYTTLEQYNTLNGEATGVEKPNTEGQADYVEPVYSPEACIPAKWIIDGSYSYCEQASEEVSYLWAKLTSYPESEDPVPNTPNRGHAGETCTTTTVEGNFVVSLYKSSSQTELLDEVLQESTIDGISVEYFISDFYDGISYQNIADFEFDNSDTDTKFSSTNPYSCSSTDPAITRLTVLQIAYDGRVADVGSGFELYLIPLTDAGDNTGFLIQPKEKKVTNDVNEYPLDINNDLCSVSGLPQALRNNPIDSPTYRILNTTACPVDPSEEVQLLIFGTYNNGTQSFEFNGSISEVLTENLTVAFTTTYKENGIEYLGVGDTFTITAGSTTYSNSIYFPISGVVTDISININSVNPNPNGTKTIIY